MKYVLGPNQSGTKLIEKLFKTSPAPIDKHTHDSSILNEQVVNHKKNTILFVIRNLESTPENKTKYESYWNKFINQASPDKNFQKRKDLYTFTYKTYVTLAKYNVNCFLCMYDQIIDKKNGYIYYCNLCKKIRINPYSKNSFDLIMSRSYNYSSENTLVNSSKKIILNDDEYFFLNKSLKKFKK